MAVWNYDSLVADLRLMVDRGDSDTDFTAALPSIFEDAERRIVRECPISIFHAEEAGVFVIGTATIPRPNSLIATEYVRYVRGATLVHLRLRPAPWLDEFLPTVGATGAPRYVALLDATTYKVSPAPDAAYNYTIGHRRHVDFLGPGTATNVLTVHYPDLLRAALYVRAALFSREDNPEQAAELQKFEQNYQTMRAAVFGNELLTAATAFEDGAVEERTGR